MRDFRETPRPVVIVAVDQPIEAAVLDIAQRARQPGNARRPAHETHAGLGRHVAGRGR
jgi:hypothetical protein